MSAIATRFPGNAFRILAWSAAACLLLVPLLARFPWTAGDYILAAAMFATAGGLIELGVHFSRGSLAYRAGAAAAVAAGFLLVWVNGAVGLLGSEENPANLVFAAVLVTALAGALLARFRAGGLVRAMLATAAVQFAIAPIAWLANWGTNSEIAIGTAIFTALWLASAALFRKAAG